MTIEERALAIRQTVLKMAVMANDEAMAKIRAGVEAQVKAGIREQVAAQVDAGIADAKVKLAAGKAKLDKSKAELRAGEAALAAAEKQLAEGKDKLSAAEDQLADGKTQLETFEAGQNPADYGSWLKGKSVVTLFEKPSLRTRVTFDVGITRLGGHCIYMDQQNGAIGKRETVRDYAKNLSRWCDGIVARVFDHGTLQGLAKYATVPVINALCNLYHPCQTLADYVTIQEHLGDVSKVKLAYFGDGNNMTNSLFVIGAILGGTVMSVCPKGWGPDAQIFSEAQEIAKKTGAKLTVTDRVEDAAG